MIFCFVWKRTPRTTLLVYFLLCFAINNFYFFFTNLTVFIFTGHYLFPFYQLSVFIILCCELVIDLFILARISQLRMSMWCTHSVVAGQHMSEEELEDKLEKGDFSVFTQRASIQTLITVMTLVCSDEGQQIHYLCNFSFICLHLSMLTSTFRMTTQLQNVKQLGNLSGCIHDKQHLCSFEEL